MPYIKFNIGESTPKVGDIVYTYKKGIWKVIEVKERLPLTPLVKLKMICRENLSIPKKEICLQIDTSWTKNAFNVLDDERERLKSLEKIMMEHFRK